MYNLDQVTHKLAYLFVSDLVQVIYTSINSGKNAFIPIIEAGIN